MTDAFPELYDIIYTKEIKENTQSDGFYMIVISSKKIHITLVMQKHCYERFITKRGIYAKLINENIQNKKCKLPHNNVKNYKLDNKHKNCEWLKKIYQI